MEWLKVVLQVSLEDNFRDTRMKKLDHELKIVNTNTVNAMKAIENVDPKYAKHMFLRNELIEQFAYHMGGGLNILEQPMCIHCERPAAWDIDGAYCFSCNKKTPRDKAITVREYLIEFSKGFTEEQLELLNMIGGESDEIIK